MKKNILILCLVTAMSLLMLSGCGASGQNSAAQNTTVTVPQSTVKTTTAETTAQQTVAPSKLVLWMPPFGTEDTLDKELWTKVTASFVKENNIDLQIEITPWDNYSEKYLTGISSGNGPDVGYMYNEIIYDFVNMDALEPLDNMLTDADRSRFYYIEHGSVNGKQYGLPIVVGNARVLFYNKDLLDAKGVQVPKTWDEFRAACKKLTDGKQYGYVQPWGDQATGTLNHAYFPFLWQAGGDLISSDGKKVVFNSEAGIKALKFIHDLKFVDKSMPDSVTSLKNVEAEQYFLAQKCAFIINGTSFSKQMDDKGIKWGYVASLTDKTQGTFIATDTLVMLSASKNKNMAFKLMMEMLKGSSMAELHKMCPFPPVASDEEYNDNPVFKSLYEGDKSMFKTLPVAKQTAKIYDYLLKNIQLVMMGQSTPEKALSDSESYANSLLND